MITAWRLLRSADPRSRLHRVRSWPQLIPDMNIAAAQEDWIVRVRLAGARGSRRHRARPRRPPDSPPRARPATGVSWRSRSRFVPRSQPSDEVHSAAPEGVEGEFDDRVDPRFPVFSAGNLAEALPGPLTPITLDVQLSGLRTANRVLGQVLALGGVVGDEWGSRAIAVFGHRPYVGVSVNIVAAAQLPGWDQHAVARDALVGQPQVGDPLPFGEPALAGGALGFSRQSGRRGTITGPVAPSQVRHAGLQRRRRGGTPRRRTAGVAAGCRPGSPDSAAAGSHSPRLDPHRAVVDRHRRHRGGAGAQRAAHSVAGVGMIMESTRVAAETAQLAAVLRGRSAAVCAGPGRQPGQHPCVVPEHRRRRGRRRRPDRAPRARGSRAGQPDVRRRSVDAADGGR